MVNSWDWSQKHNNQEKNMQKVQQNKKKLLSRQLLVLRTCYKFIQFINTDTY